MLRRSLLAAALTAFVAAPAAAQTYPDRPVTLIVPYAAGGAVRRARPPARAVHVAEPRPDGRHRKCRRRRRHHGRRARGAGRARRLYAAHSPSGAGGGGDALPQPRLRHGQGFRARRASSIRGRSSSCRSSGIEARTIAEFLDHVKRSGRNISFGTAGVGSGSHLCNMMLQSALGTKFNEIPYRGTGPAMNDLVAGQLDALCDQTTNSIPQIQGNRIRPYAVTATERVQQLPSLPTLHEAGPRQFRGHRLACALCAAGHAGCRHPAAQRGTRSRAEGSDGARPLRRPRHHALSGRPARSGRGARPART
jgi:hypothetical protein